eukprot:10569973-Heterocapsa_arctica.AAC.1
MHFNIQLKRETDISTEQSNTHSENTRVESAKESAVANHRGNDQPKVTHFPDNFQVPPVSGRGGPISLAGTKYSWKPD